MGKATPIILRMYVHMVKGWERNLGYVMGYDMEKKGWQK